LSSPKDVPRALLISPPVYDFALYDLHIAPFGLVRVGRAFEAAGYCTELVDALSTEDERSRARLGTPKRRADGTGKLFRKRVRWPLGVNPLDRSFGRYGMEEESLKARIGAAFGGERPDVVLVTSGMTYWYPGVVEAVRLARTVYPRVPVVVGGVYATLLPEHCAAATGADFVAAGSSLSRTAGFLEARGLPAPAVPEGEQHPGVPVAPSVVPSGRGSAAIRLNRGCPYRCDYCAANVLCPTFSPGHPETAFAEVRRLFEQHGTRNFGFYDDALLVGKRQVFRHFLELVAAQWPRAAAATDRRGAAGVEPGGACGESAAPSFYLPNAVHMRHLDEETARLMKEAGVEEVRLGFESDDEGFHADHNAGAGTVGTKTGRTSLREVSRILRSAGFGTSQVGVYVLAGLPGQRREEVEHAVRSAGEEGVNVYVSEFSPVPGSSLWERCVAQSRFPVDEEPLYQNNTLLPNAWDGFTSADLAEVKNLAAAYRHGLRCKGGESA
jgi:radical SAM superfamily enzyme YgiQ (UPF0313 family)